METLMMFEVTWNYNGRGGNRTVYDSLAEAKRFFNYIRSKPGTTRAELRSV
jgi:hypothetical protein